MRSAVHKSAKNPRRDSFVYKGHYITKQSMSRYQGRHRSLDPESSSTASEISSVPLVEDEC